MIVKIRIFWDLMSFTLLDMHQHFRGRCYFNLQEKSIERRLSFRKEDAASSSKWNVSYIPKYITSTRTIALITHCYKHIKCHKWGRGHVFLHEIKQTPCLMSASELYQPSDCRLSAKLVPTFEVRGCCVVSTMNPHGSILGFLDPTTFAVREYCVVSTTYPHGCILGFLDRSRYYFFQVAPQLYSRGWVDPVPDPLLLRKSGSARNRTLHLSQELLTTRPKKQSTFFDITYINWVCTSWKTQYISVL
jgi:hypothetical protein